MLRSTQFILKQSTKLSRPMAVASREPSLKNVPLLLTRTSSTTSNASSSDYFSTSAGDGGDSSPTSSFSTSFSTYPSMSSDISDAIAQEVPSDIVAAQHGSSNCYRSVDEPTGCEDYDRYELHHPPCERTQVSYYDTSWGLGLGW